MTRFRLFAGTALCVLVGAGFMTIPIWFSDWVHKPASASQSVFPLSKAIERDEQCPGGYYALTFDDGPHPDHTEKLVKVLRDMKVPATFFNIGELAAENPKLVDLQRTVGDVEVHSWHHDDYTQLSEDQIKADIARSLPYVGGHPKFMRPPFGASDAHVRKAIRESGLIETMWTVDTNDWKQPYTQEKIVKEGLTVEAGGIILLHDGWPYVRSALLELISDLNGRGMCPGKLEQSPKPSYMRGLTINYPFNVRAGKP